MSAPQQPQFQAQPPTGPGPMHTPAPHSGTAPTSGTVATAGTRPGAVRAVAVLGFVQAGFNAMGAMMSLQGAGQLAEFGLRRTSVGSSLTILAVLGLASGALLIIGGLAVLKGKALLITAGATVSILLSIWWAVEFDYVRQLQMTALMMAGLPVIILGLLFGTPARQWVRFELPTVPAAGNVTGAAAAAWPTDPTSAATTATNDPTTVFVRPAPTASVPAGWQVDPTGRHQVRYWDGAGWTVHVADNGITGTDPL